jgi:hypothetical protein
MSMLCGTSPNSVPNALEVPEAQADALRAGTKGDEVVKDESARQPSAQLLAPDAGGYLQVASTK